MRRLIIICALLEIFFISLIVYAFSLQKDYVCSRDATTTPVTTERVNTIPWEIEEPIYIYEWLENVKM